MQPPPRRPRPRTADEFRAFHREIRANNPLRVPPGFELRDGDVVISTYPKCGTTWAQQIVHGLRTRGSMEFEEISLVVPWIETAPILAIDLDAPQVAEPRAFKSHMPWYKLPRGGRNIFITRDPGDTLVSFYHFQNGVMFERDAVDIETFAHVLFMTEAPNGRYWDHVKSWWEVRERDDVLFLCFEDMKDDLRAIVARIAAFCRIDADDALIDLATRQASFEFMRAHVSQFDDHPTTRAFTDMMGFPPAQTTKVRAGRVGDGKAELTPQIAAMLDDTWQSEIAEPLGLASYEALRAGLRG